MLFNQICSWSRGVLRLNRQMRVEIPYKQIIKQTRTPHFAKAFLLFFIWDTRSCFIFLKNPLWPEAVEQMKGRDSVP